MNDRKRSRILTSDKEPNKRQRQTDDISTRFQNPSGVPFAYKSSDLNTIEREGYVQRIGYSERYYDDNMEYRHVILPKPLFRLVPTVYKNVLLVEHDWRSLGITMSAGWVHYLIHRPEPHVFLFRREKYYQEKYGNGLKPVLQTSYSHIDNDQTNDTKQNAKIERRKILNGKCLAREKENSVDSEGEHVESGEESESEIGQANPFPFYDLPSLVKFLQQSMRNADVMLRLNNEINFNDHMESASKHLNASLVDRDIPRAIISACIPRSEVARTYFTHMTKTEYQHHSR
ncbi:hypothetical protein BC829DRAFT_147487 [Chytridium lagenaria]|nr:hypothetical protein BC829DRAFT_147487 [Chytridium lagenaria]